ncbi:MAG TPA: FAD-dependent oxidoreductase [Cellvibrionaceae bacterium]
MKVDVTIIGAGIQGAGIAQAAAAAGYKVLVLEQTAIAAGTSSKSSKLIHGGLRYLESAQFSLVRESLAERALLLKLAPELVKLRHLHIPVYAHSNRSSLTIGMGLRLYRALSGFDNSTRFQRLGPQEWDQLPGLETQGLKQVFRYQEAQTDDAALTRAVLASAQQFDCQLLMPAQFNGAELHSEGAKVRYTSAGSEHTIDTRVLVNCAGPWASAINMLISPTPNLPAVELVQGSHLLLPPLLDQAFYLESAADGRAVFALPWQGKLLLGTTETPHQGAPEDAHCHPHEMHYLLNVLKHYFPDLHPLPSSAESFAGLRVLPKADGSAFNRPREVMLCTDQAQQPSVLTVMGGKLTTYRATAAHALEAIKPSLATRKPLADTRELSLKPID